MEGKYTHYNEINNAYIDEKSIKERLISWAVIATLPIDKIRYLIPRKTGCRQSACMTLLAVINGYPRSSAFQLRMLMHSNDEAMVKNLDHLQSLGLVKSIGKPRLIIPFQKFKVDKGWVITQSGRDVLRKILS